MHAVLVVPFGVVCISGTVIETTQLAAAGALLDEV